MADEMLRIAGRHVDENGVGSAKAFRTDSNGNQFIKTNSKRSLFGADVTLDAGVTVETDILPSDEYSFAKAIIVLAVARDIKVSIKRYTYRNARYEGGDYEVIYNSDKSSIHHFIEYPIFEGFYSLKVENLSSYGTTISENTVEVRIPDGLPYMDKKINTLLENTKNIIDIDSGEVQSLVDKGTHNFSIDTKCKEVIISFYADNHNDIKNELGLKVSRYRVRNADLASMGELRGESLEGFQPVLWKEEHLSGGATPLITLLSPYQNDIEVKNLTGKTISFKYVITGYN